MEKKYDNKEWLVVNSFGSFAMGSFDRVPRRKYHSLWTLREASNGECLNILSDLIEEVSVRSNAGPSEKKEKGLKAANSEKPLEARTTRLLDLDFGGGPLGSGRQFLTDVISSSSSVQWTYKFPWGELRRTLELLDDPEGVRITYNFSSESPLQFEIAPLFLVRPWHHLTQSNLALDGRLFSEDIPDLKSTPDLRPGDPSSSNSSSKPSPQTPFRRTWRFNPYGNLAPLRISAGSTEQDPALWIDGVWYKHLHYKYEVDRGYPSQEDAFLPGWITLKLPKGSSSAWIEITDGRASGRCSTLSAPASKESTLFERSGQFLMRSHSGHLGIVAGFPWFEVWARDTFVAVPGLCLWQGENPAAKARRQFGFDLLMSWGQQLLRSQTSAIPGSNNTGADVPLLFFRALRLCRNEVPADWKKFKDPLLGIALPLLERMFHGEQGDISTVTDLGYFVRPHTRPSGWMDAVIGRECITPRHGYPVDLQGLFFDAIGFILEEVHGSPGTSTSLQSYQYWLDAAQVRFESIFWKSSLGYLADVFDGREADLSLRPNQLWALACPTQLIDPSHALKALDQVRSHLLVPKGLRTLSPKDSRYHPRCAGTQEQRDRAYHQGTVWPWLLGVYADATLRHRGSTATQNELKPIVESLLDEMENGPCSGHISEIFDGDAPHTARGTPAQAWSLSELIRVRRMINL